MTPDDLVNYWRCANQQEFRNIMYLFRDKNPEGFEQLAQLIAAYKFKRNPEAWKKFEDEKTKGA